MMLVASSKRLLRVGACARLAQPDSDELMKDRLHGFYQGTEDYDTRAT